MNQFVLIFLGILIFSGCKAKAPTTKTIYEIKKVADDIQLPKPALDLLNKEISQEFKNISPVFVFVPLTVEFNDHGQSVFKQPHFQIKFEKGGGAIDLSEYINGRGSFYLHFPESQFNPDWKLLHLFYISQSPVKSIGADKYGLGCGRWLDLKDQFKKLTQPDFLKLNTTSERHLHVLAGHYVFVFREKNQILLTQMTVTDSKTSEKMCRTTKVASRE